MPVSVFPAPRERRPCRVPAPGAGSLLLPCPAGITPQGWRPLLLRAGEGSAGPGGHGDGRSSGSTGPLGHPLPARMAAVLRARHRGASGQGLPGDLPCAGPATAVVETGQGEAAPGQEGAGAVPCHWSLAGRG